MKKPKQYPQQVKIKTSEENPEPMELVASSIIEIADSFKKIQNSKLSQKAIILLIQDQTGHARSTIKEILDVAPRIAEIYLKK